jgi:hypothetical protein
MKSSQYTVSNIVGMDCHVVAVAVGGVVNAVPGALTDVARAEQEQDGRSRFAPNSLPVSILPPRRAVTLSRLNASARPYI